jgi:nucleoid-associated protein YgaU
MKSQRLYAMLATVLLWSSITFAQDMTKDQWQQEVNRLTQLRTELQAKLKQATTDVTTAQALSARLDGDINKCMDELYALVGADAQKAAAYRAEIEAAERSVSELDGLSDADLSARSADLKALAASAKSLRENKLSLIPEFSERLDALDQKIAGLQKRSAALTASGADEYTVGSGDNLWNIARKQDIYSNGRLWPKIWKGNARIKDPDIIRPGQKLTIPPAGDLSPEEKAAARRHYSKKNQGIQ